jgi:hypothetical protein
VSKRLKEQKDDYERACRHILAESTTYDYVNELAAKIDFTGLPVVGVYPYDIYCTFKSIDQVLRQIALLESQGYEFDYEGLEARKSDGQISLRITNCAVSSIIYIRFIMAYDAICKIVEHKRTVTREVEEVERVVICQG